jgi:hypothetical protein
VTDKRRSDFFRNSRLSRQGFWLYSPISILGFPVSVLVANKDASPLITLATGLILTLITYLIYLFQLIIFKYLIQGQAIRVIFFFIIPLITGSSRGVIFYYFVEFLDLNQPSDFNNRILSSTFTTVFWLVLANYIISVSRNFRYQYQAALHHYLLGESANKKSGNISDENKKVLENLQVRLSASVKKYIDKDDPDSFRSLSGVLTNQINDQIKPLSKRILIKNLSEFPSVQHKQLRKDALISLDFSWKWFFLIITSLALTSNISLRGLSETALRTISFLIPLYLLIVIFKKFRQAIKIFVIWSNLIFLILVGIVPVILSEGVAQLLKYDGNWLATFIISPVAPVVMYILALLHLTQQDRKMIIDTLQKSTAEKSSDLPGEIAIESAAIASYLHNTLQSELLALSRQLEVAANEQDPLKSAALLQRVSSRVNRSIADDYKQFADSPLERLDVVIESWRGILDIHIEIPKELLTENRKNSTIVQTIEEVATNISRYDVASELIVSAQAKGEGIILTFQSNGSGKLVKSKGSGTAWLNQIARSEWSIEKNRIGTILTIEI